MGQVLSNLSTILFGRKKRAETNDEENVYHSLDHCQEVKPLFHPTSGKTRVSEKDEGSIAIIVDSGVEVVEKIKHILNVSNGGKIRVPKDGSGSKAKKGRVLQKERRIKHYCSSHKILLVGEGDFSFSACLANVFGSADNMVATSLNSEGFLQKNYGKAMSNISDLKSRGCMVLHGVDATNMSDHKILKSMRFDRIVFNFPHAGFFNKESRETQISRHQKLITLFFKNAKKMLCEEGEIHISHKLQY
ncbi:uncharacterized protein At4g26485-like isoform X2 [Macadamia integrifolia]|uniref:uncharacterized protein At4g26485-like isoform X2 n=1 Tax=Macadamia integrifolia TaxID=60698 RepID=UPI001C4F6E4A|nr:uncharacterized protein At4g26485-like isoform X2 [Macadamia integrifolia]